MSSMIDSINAFGREDFFTYGLFNSILMILLFLGIAYILRRMIQRYVKRKQFSNEAFIMRMVRIVIYTLASYACLSLFKPFDSILGKLWGSAGILAVVFGLAAQESLGNMVNGILYIGTDRGVWLLVGNTFFPLQGADALASKRIRGIIPYKKGVLVVTAYNGLYYCDGRTMEPFVTGAEEFMRENEVFCVAKKDDKIALGTIHKGVVLVDCSTMQLK